MDLTPDQIRHLLEMGAEIFCEGPPPWYVQVGIAAIDAYFAHYYCPPEETDVDENILEKLKAIPCPYPVAKFDAEGKFSYN